MRTVSKQEFVEHAARVLDDVTPSEDITVTENGAPRWIISASGAEAALTRHERNGRYTPPVADPGPWPDEISGPRYSDAEAEALLSELKGDF